MFNLHGKLSQKMTQFMGSRSRILLGRGIIPPHRDRFGMPKTPYYQAPMTDKATDEVLAKAPPKAG